MTLLSTALIGTWELVSREDRNVAGELRSDPNLGADPLGLLICDRSGRFAVQFMKRDRFAPPAEPSAVGQKNNTRAVNGYDAYFGSYVVDDARRTVTQTLHAALSTENVGHVITRAMSVDGDTLLISLNTTSFHGEPVTRTLRWRRVA